MKQFQFEYRDANHFNHEMARILRYVKDTQYSNIVFQIFTGRPEYSDIKPIVDSIEELFPDAYYYGGQSFGNIIEGRVSEYATLIVCSIYEYESTKIGHLYVDANTENCPAEETIKKFTDYVKANPWIKAIEMLSSIKAAHSLLSDVHTFDIPNDIQMFGGIACNPTSIEIENGFVFSKGHEANASSMVLLFMGGEDIHIDSTYILGWKPLGKEFEITASDGAVIKELNGTPTFDIYEKYLKLSRSDDFFANAFEFPFLIEENGIYCLRNPLSVFDDGSVLTTVVVKDGTKVRLAYGDPTTIIDTICGRLKGVSAFGPDVIRIYSCAVRNIFWSGSVSQETIPFESIAPTTGFYTHGEFLKLNDYLFNFNCTLVVASIREGEHIEIDFEDDEVNIEQGRKLSLVSRMVNFISAATEELEEANQKLVKLSITDGLTQLYNRAETQTRIESSLVNFQKSDFGLIMMDIDNFKSVNDTFGHDKGDEVIKGLAKILNDYAAAHEGSFAGRWGGEEFMLAVRTDNETELVKIAETLRMKFADTKFSIGKQVTVSVGATVPLYGDTWEQVCKRADDALYESKSNGKNRVTLKIKN